MANFILNGLLRIWGYLRTSGKINPPESIPNQKKLIEDFTVLNELEIQGFLIDEQKTGTNTDREGYQTLLSLIEKGEIDVVLVTFFDRLGRNAEELIKIMLLMKSKDIECISVSDNRRLSSMSHNEIAFIALMAEETNRALTKRIKTSKENTLRGGYYFYQLPLGYRKGKNKSVLLDAQEALIVKEVFELYLAGNDSKSIAKRFNKSNVANRIWSTHLVEKILTNRMYTGKKYKRIKDENEVRYELLSPVEHEAIIDEETFLKTSEEVNEKIVKREKRKYKKVSHYFKNVLHCPECLTKMRMQKHYFFCANKDCPMLRIKKEKLEPLLLEYVAGLDRKNDTVKEKLHLYQKSLKQLTKEKVQIQRAFAINRMSKVRFEERMFNIVQDIKAIHKKINYGAYQGDDVTYTTLIEAGKVEELNKLMQRKKIKLTFTQQGDSYLIREL